MANPIVRTGVQNDAAPLAALRWASRTDEERRREPFSTFEVRFLAWLGAAMASRKWHVVVASHETTLVGCMYLHCVDTVPVPGVIDRAWGYVTHAYVVERHRNRGIGRELLERLIRNAIAIGLIELHVWPSQGALSLYTRAGFHSPEQQREGDESDEPSYVLPLAGMLR